jgi:hypothetical protein
VPQTGISKLDPAQELVMHKEFLKAASRAQELTSFAETQGTRLSSQQSLHFTQDVR